MDQGLKSFPMDDDVVILGDGISQRMPENWNGTDERHRPCGRYYTWCAYGIGGGCCDRWHACCCRNGRHCRRHGPC